MENKARSLVDTGSFWFPEGVSALSRNVDVLYYFVFWVSLVLFLGILFITFFFLYKYKSSDLNTKASAQVTHNNTLEIVWTVIPLILVMFVFVWGYRDYLKLTVPPADAMEIRVMGRKWSWAFEYPKQGFQSEVLVVPMGVPVKLIMSSQDVLHSFYLPNFRVKRDCIPNRYTRIWFEAEKLGDYQIFCTEYCGDQHSNMSAILRVLSPEDYEEWLISSNADLPLDKKGEKLYSIQGCNACHSIDGTRQIGPTWKGLYNSYKDIEGEMILADDNYIRESIVKPMAKIVPTYPPNMPSYAGILNDDEINALIEYIKTLK